jgi:hypothetical protein
MSFGTEFSWASDRFSAASGEDRKKLSNHLFWIVWRSRGKRGLGWRCIDDWTKATPVTFSDLPIITNDDVDWVD